MRASKYIAIGIVFLLAAVVQGSLRYITPELISTFQNNPILINVLAGLSHNKFYTSVIASTIMASQLLLGIILYPRDYIKKRKTKILKRIHSNLFNDDTNHRVTLFKEVGYIHALWEYVWTLFYHLRPKYFFRFLLHLKKFPCPANYLIIDIREGRFKKSRTMFKVEENILGNCEGIVGMIRCQKAMSLCVSDLPDITNIDLDSIDLSNMRKNETKTVREYMEKGYIKNIESLKILHLKSRHFLGSVIYKTEGVPCAMLLVDSTSESNPFTEKVVDKFTVYSEFLTDLIS